MWKSCRLSCARIATIGTEDTRKNVKTSIAFVLETDVAPRISFAGTGKGQNGMIEVKKANHCRTCNCCHGNEDVKEITFWGLISGTTVALCRECREAARMALTDERQEQEEITKTFDQIRKAQCEFHAEYGRTPEKIYMTPGLYQKLKADAEKRGFVEPPCPHIARINGARIELIDAPGDMAFFGTLAVGKPIIT